MIKQKQNDECFGFWSEEECACLLEGIDHDEFAKLKRLANEFVKLSALSRINPEFKFDRARELAANRDRLEKISRVEKIQAELRCDVTKGILTPDNIVKTKKTYIPIFKDSSVGIPGQKKYFFSSTSIMDWWLFKGRNVNDKLCALAKNLNLLTNKQKLDYNNKPSWTWVEAIYILQGFQPCHQTSDEEVSSHFPLMVKAFMRSIQSGCIGKEETQQGKKTVIDSPERWQNFWASIKKTAGDKKKGDSKQPTKKVTKVSPIFAKFKNLRANEITFEMMENQTASVTIRRKKFKVNPDDLGLNLGEYGWKLLVGGAFEQGKLSGALKKLNSSSDYLAEKGRIKVIVSRLRRNLRNSMGLESNPISYTKGDGYKFTFGNMTHELLKDTSSSKGEDAMDYLNYKDIFDNQNRSNRCSEDKYEDEYEDEDEDF